METRKLLTIDEINQKLDSLKGRAESGEPVQAEYRKLLLDIPKKKKKFQELRKRLYEDYASSMYMLADFMNENQLQQFLNLNIDNIKKLKKFEGEYLKNNAPDLAQFSEDFNKTAAYVRQDILGDGNASKMVLAIAYWINVAYYVSFEAKIKNRNLGLAIHSALHGHSIENIRNRANRYGVSLLNMGDEEKLRKIDELYSSMHNFENLKKTYQVDDQIPYLGLFQTDITSVREGAALKKQREEQGIENVDDKINGILNPLIRMKSSFEQYKGQKDKQSKTLLAEISSIIISDDEEEARQNREDNLSRSIISKEESKKSIDKKTSLARKLVVEIKFEREKKDFPKKGESKSNWEKILAKPPKINQKSEVEINSFHEACKKAIKNTNFISELENISGSDNRKGTITVGKIKNVDLTQIAANFGSNPTYKVEFRSNGQEISLILRVNSKEDSQMERTRALSDINKEKYLTKQYGQGITFKQDGEEKIIEISEFCHEGNLSDKIKKLKTDKRMSVKSERPLRALKYLENIQEMIAAFNIEGVYFPDIKPGNFIINNDGRLVLSDTKTLVTLPPGTNPLNAPIKGVITTAANEPAGVINGNEIDLIALQDYLIGLTIYEFATGELPAKDATGRHPFNFGHKVFSGEEGDKLKNYLQRLTQYQASKDMNFDVPPPSTPPVPPSDVVSETGSEEKKKTIEVDIIHEDIDENKDKIDTMLEDTDKILENIELMASDLENKISEIKDEEQSDDFNFDEIDELLNEVINDLETDKNIKDQNKKIRSDPDLNNPIILPEVTNFIEHLKILNLNEVLESEDKIKVIYRDFLTKFIESNKLKPGVLGSLLAYFKNNTSELKKFRTLILDKRFQGTVDLTYSIEINKIFNNLLPPSEAPPSPPSVDEKKSNLEVEKMTDEIHKTLEISQVSDSFEQISKDDLWDLEVLSEKFNFILTSLNEIKRFDDSIRPFNEFSPPLREMAVNDIKTTVDQINEIIFQMENDIDKNPDFKAALENVFQGKVKNFNELFQILDKDIKFPDLQLEEFMNRLENFTEKVNNIIKQYDLKSISELKISDDESLIADNLPPPPVSQVEGVNHLIDDISENKPEEDLEENENRELIIEDTQIISDERKKEQQREEKQKLESEDKENIGLVLPRVSDIKALNAKAAEKEEMRNRSNPFVLREQNNFPQETRTPRTVEMEEIVLPSKIDQTAENYASAANDYERICALMDNDSVWDNIKSDAKSNRRNEYHELFEDVRKLIQLIDENNAGDNDEIIKQKYLDFSEKYINPDSSQAVEFRGPNKRLLEEITAQVSEGKIKISTDISNKLKVILQGNVAFQILMASVPPLLREIKAKAENLTETQRSARRKEKSRVSMPPLPPIPSGAQEREPLTGKPENDERKVIGSPSTMTKAADDETQNASLNSLYLDPALGNVEPPPEQSAPSLINPLLSQPSQPSPLPKQDQTKTKGKGFFARFNAYRKKHPVLAGLMIAGAIAGVALFITGTVLTGGALGVVGGAAAGALAGVFGGLGAGAVGGGLMVGGGVLAVASIGVTYDQVRKFSLQEKMNKLTENKTEKAQQENSKTSNGDMSKRLSQKREVSKAPSLQKSASQAESKQEASPLIPVKRDAKGIPYYGDFAAITKTKEAAIDEIKNRVQIARPQGIPSGLAAQLDKTTPLLEGDKARFIVQKIIDKNLIIQTGTVQSIDQAKHACRSDFYFDDPAKFRAVKRSHSAFSLLPRTSIPGSPVMEWAAAQVENFRVINSNKDLPVRIIRGNMPMVCVEALMLYCETKGIKYQHDTKIKIEKAQVSLLKEKWHQWKDRRAVFTEVTVGGPKDSRNRFTR